MEIQDKNTISAVLLVLIFILSSGCSTTSSQKVDENLSGKPDIFLITIDTLRADYVGAYGGSIATPALDALAEDGARFENAITEVPLTLPAHASLLTGSYPLTTGVHDNLGYYLDEKFETIAERLSQTDYRTAAFVGAYVLSSKWGLSQGFDVYEDRFTGPAPGASPTEGIERRAEEVIRLASAWIEENGRSEAALFCWIHLFDPHDPYDPPEPFRSRYRKDQYGGEVAYTDAALGELIKILQERGRYEDSLVIVAGDHGEALGAHGEPTHGFFLYEETLRIPLIIKLPAQQRIRNRVVEGTVQLVDIAPTIYQVAGLRGFHELQGRGLLGAMLGKEAITDRPAYSETYYPNQFGWSNLRSWRIYPHKYVLAPKAELYDLSEDSGETTNRAVNERSLAGRFREDILAFEAQHKSGLDDTARRDLSPADLERFASLGYVGGIAPSLEDAEQTLPDPKDRLQEYLAINRAMNFISEKEFGDAHSALSDFGSAPESDTVRFLRGQAYFGMSRYQEAARELGAVVDSDGNNAYARFYLAQTYFEIGESKRAEELLLGLLEKDSQFFPAHNYLGLIYSDQGRIDEAIDAFAQAVAIHEDAQAYQMLGYLHTRRQQPRKAADSLERAVSLNPESALSYLYLANAYHLLGQERQARQSYEKAFELDPTLREKLR